MHFIHSYIINNESVLHLIPVLNQKINEYDCPIFLRGFETQIYQELFDKFPMNLDAGWTDMVAINEKKLIMMVRDRGHALSIEISLKKDIARIEYFIPKICNIEMVNSLPGVNKIANDNLGTTGVIEVPIDNLVDVLFDFISKVPTDDDMILETKKII